jgi:hypothetical protein
MIGLLAEEQQNNNAFKPALLTRTEIEWLLGKYHGSRKFEKTMRYRIRQKIKSLIDYEIPMLVDKDFLTIGRLTATVITNSNRVINNDHYDKLEKAQNELHWQKEGSLGRDLDPGPLPYQGLSHYNRSRLQIPSQGSLVHRK